MKRTPLNRISKKKRQEHQDEKKIRAALWERCKGCCESCGRPAEQCFGGVHPHEPKFRSHGGRVSMDSIMLCNTCHGNKGHNLRIIEHGFNDK
jgi:5-methylcytosine-specific restriction endonuclease McrA